MSALVKNPDDIKIAMMGIVDNNGHPYSWSAIFNGYDSDEMAKCPYALIPDYLGKQPKSEIGIPGAKVTHIWGENREEAEKVAESSLVPNVVDKPEDVIGEVDAIIIPTDIGHEHVERARLFVEAGLPVFVDKPMIDNESDLKTFKRWIVDEGHPIISNSCMRYAKELEPYHGGAPEFGDLRFISSTMPKAWDRYGIHTLEAIYPILGPGFISCRNSGSSGRDIVHLKHKKNVDCVAVNNYDMAGGIGLIQLVGTQDHVNIHMKDFFYAFKKQLLGFVDYLRTGKPPFGFDETEELMKMVIAGITSAEKGGVEIFLDEIALS